MRSTLPPVPHSPRLSLVALLTLLALVAGVTVAPPRAGAIPSNSTDGQLRIGGLLPQTGNLAFLDPQTEAAARLAVQRINRAGGVLGKPVRWIPGDSGDLGDDQVTKTANRHVGARVDAVVGPLSNTQAFKAIDTLTAAGRIVISPSNTSVALASYPDNGLYFRTSPNDTLQGRAVIDNMRRAEAKRVMILARNGEYGTGLSNNIARQGRAEGIEMLHLRYGDEPDTAALAKLTSNKKPDAVIIVGFEETTAIIQALNRQGVDGLNTLIQLVDGNTGEYVSGALDESERPVFNGVQGIVPGARTSRPLADALLRLEPNLENGAYSSETYDAVIVLALAAEQAKTDDPSKVALEIPKVTRKGVPCVNFIRCRALIRRSVDVDYQGESGPLTMNPQGELIVGPFSQFYWGDDGNIDASRTEVRFSRFRPRQSQKGRSVGAEGE